MKIKEYYEAVCAGREVRKHLIALRDELKEEKNAREFAYLLGGDFSVLCGLLEDADPKIRRNAAAILGKMESEDLLPILFDAYRREKTLFIRADYLRAMSGMDYSPVLGALQERIDELCGAELPPEERKHAAEELRVLRGMVQGSQKREPHEFTGWHVPADVILVTNRCQREVTARQIRRGKVTMLAGGVRVRGAETADLREIRTWTELLFPLETGENAAALTLPAGEMRADAAQRIGGALAGPLLGFAERMHREGGAFCFRIEMKSAAEPERKGVFLRRLSDAMERASGGQLINSVSDYELELRLVGRKDGSLVPMVRLCTIPDERFAYRREYVASSIAPANAALAAELARPWLREGAQVLDPFCGVGTMLIERDRAVKAGIMYGVDIFGEAVEKARANAELAGRQVFYIKKNFFEFEHGYLFDEIITDLPQVTAGHPRQEISALYRDFFGAVGRHLKPDAVLILHTTEPRLVGEALRGRGEYRIEARYLLNEKRGTEVFVLQRHGRA